MNIIEKMKFGEIDTLKKGQGEILETELVAKNFARVMYEPKI